MSEETLILAENLTKRFSAAAPPAIDRLRARIGPGQVTGVVGPDGAGKTTLLRLFAGLLLPSDGRVVRLRRRHAHRTGRDPAASQLHAAAVRALRGPVGAGKPEPVRRSAERGRRRAPGRLRAAAGLHRPRAVYRPARRQALRRHEAEARPGLRLDPDAPSPVARRAQRRRRPDLAPRAVEDGLRPRRPRHRRRLEHVLPRRSRALRPSAPAPRGKGPLRRTAQGADGARRGPQFSGRRGRPGRTTASGPSRSGAPRSSTA